MTGTIVSADGLDHRRRRLLYRSWHRGTREMDLIMGRFADATIATLKEAELTQFEQLCDLPDVDLYAWIAGERPVPAAFDTEIFRRLRTFTLGNEQVRK